MSCVTFSSPNGLRSRPADVPEASRWDARRVASSMTALKLLPARCVGDVGGSENGPWSGVGESSMIVKAVESRPGLPTGDENFSRTGEIRASFSWLLVREGIISPSGLVLTLLALGFDCFFSPLPTRTTTGRTGMAVCALALLRKVEPTLNVLFAVLTGRRLLYLS